MTPDDLVKTAAAIGQLIQIAVGAYERLRKAAADVGVDEDTLARLDRELPLEIAKWKREAGQI